MNTEQELFFKELGRIQDMVIGVSLCKQDKYKNTKELLEDATYEAICGIYEIIDGYGLVKNHICCDKIEIETSPFSHLCC